MDTLNHIGEYLPIAQFGPLIVPALIRYSSIASFIGKTCKTNQTERTVHGADSVVVIASLRITEDTGSIPDKA